MGRDGDITFFDADGTRWTVVPILPSRDVLGPTPLRLEFSSEAGEHRVGSAELPEGTTWNAVNDLAWRALLRQAAIVT